VNIELAKLEGWRAGELSMMGHWWVPPDDESHEGSWDLSGSNGEAALKMSGQDLTLMYE
jgi:hypothetical protein